MEDSPNELREEARKALDDYELNLKQKELNHAIEELRLEKKSLETRMEKNKFFRKLLYPDMIFINVDQDIRASKAVLDDQISSKIDELATILQYKKNLRSSIALYSIQIEHLKNQHKQKEKAELKSLKMELKSRKDNICHRSNSVHQLEHNYYYGLLS